jgi:hypothetical protein
MSFGDVRMDNAFDRWRTGNYGEDQFKGCDEYDEMVDHTCSNCICMAWCPTFEKFCNGDNFDDCLIIQDIMNKQYERDSELSAQMERDYERMMDEDCDELSRESFRDVEKQYPDDLIDELYANEEPDDYLIEKVS